MTLIRPQNPDEQMDDYLNFIGNLLQEAIDYLTATQITTERQRDMMMPIIRRVKRKAIHIQHSAHPAEPKA